MQSDNQEKNIISDRKRSRQEFESDSNDDDEEDDLFYSVKIQWSAYCPLYALRSDYGMDLPWIFSQEQSQEIETFHQQSKDGSKLEIEQDGFVYLFEIVDERV